nr:atherin-like [Vulpes vulpes]
MKRMKRLLKPVREAAGGGRRAGLACGARPSRPQPAASLSEDTSSAQREKRASESQSPGQHRPPRAAREAAFGRRPTAGARRRGAPRRRSRFRVRQAPGPSDRTFPEARPGARTAAQRRPAPPSGEGCAPPRPAPPRPTRRSLNPGGPQEKDRETEVGKALPTAVRRRPRPTQSFGLRGLRLGRGLRRATPAEDKVRGAGGLGTQLAAAAEVGLRGNLFALRCFACVWHALGPLACERRARGPVLRMVHKAPVLKYPEAGRTLVAPAQHLWSPCCCFDPTVKNLLE